MMKGKEKILSYFQEIGPSDRIKMTKAGHLSIECCWRTTQQVAEAVDLSIRHTRRILAEFAKKDILSDIYHPYPEHFWYLEGKIQTRNNVRKSNSSGCIGESRNEK